MDNQIISNRIIAKNTIMLYIRMIIIMVVSLYTTRVILNVLGETDYGIYNIVGSVVVSMIFIQNSLMSATQRYLSYEIGLGEKGKVASVFSSSLNLHIKFILLIVFFLETIGLWLLNCVLVIPDDRVFAANYVYQFSILTFCLNLIRIPYNSIIISYESMNIYAFLSIAEALLKLVVVIMIKYFYSDKLIAYGFLILAITMIINALYIYYCRIHYRKETVFNIRGNKTVISNMRGFLGWNLLGGISGVAISEGPNYFMNYYLGVSVNAAMGIAKQVSSAVYQFTANFQTAFNPQIVKTYASDEKKILFNLINNTSLLSFILLFIIALPIILCSDYIFTLWLIDVPQYTIIFCILIILSQFMSALGSPLWMVAHATGKIKTYQITVSLINLTIVPISFLILFGGYEPYYILVFQVFISSTTLVYRLFFAWHKLGFPIRIYIKEVISKCVYLTLIIVPIPLYFKVNAITAMDNIIVVILSVVISVPAIFFIGLNEDTRYEIRHFIRQKFT